MEGLDETVLAAWLSSELFLEPPVLFELVPGGRSNLTYVVRDGTGRAVVLRRPPTGHVLPTAHDMAREFRIITALYPTPVPVPEPVALCLDESVNGAPFYVMQYVAGHVLRDQETAERELASTARRQASESMVDVLASLHAVDPDSVGLGDLGRREGYVARQLSRWHGQFDKMQVEGYERADVVDDVFERLSSAVPPQSETTVVHGDYRLDNAVVDDEGKVCAVLDWEICTLGDPLADVGLLLVYWSQPGDEVLALGSAPTLAAGFASREWLSSRYEELTGRDLSGIGYYVAFGYWKLACILQGVFFRYLGGAGGGDPTGVDMFAGHVRSLAGAARDWLDRR